jgi:hypothetical protein
MLIAGEAGPIAGIGKGQPFRDGRIAARICQFRLWGQNRLLATSIPQFTITPTSSTPRARLAAACTSSRGSLARSGSPAPTRIRVPVAGRGGDARTRARIRRHRRHTRQPIRDSAERLRGHVRRPHQVPAPSRPRLLRGRTSGLLARITTTEQRVRRARRRPEPPPATCEHARARRVIEQEIRT